MHELRTLSAYSTTLTLEQRMNPWRDAEILRSRVASQAGGTQ